MLAVVNLSILALLFACLHLFKIKNKSLSFRILISLLLSIFYGMYLKLVAEQAGTFIIKNILYFTGHAYLSFLKMLVIPLIVTSIINTILNLGANTISDIKKISFYTCGILLSLTAIGAMIGMVIGKLFAIGTGLSFKALIAAPKPTQANLADTILSMLPSNPIAIMANENTIAVVLFSVLFGTAARMLQTQEPTKIEIFKNLINALFAITKKLTALILELTPYGIFALIALLLLDNGIGVFLTMLNFVIAIYTAMFFMFVVHSIILFLCGHYPWQYIKNAYAALLVAFTTRSSFGTMPVTEETLSKKFKTSQAIATFVPSIGATIGMNACAGIFPAMLVVMTLTILHQPLTWELMCMIVFVNTIASLGISGIPGTAYVAASITLSSLNLPYAILALVQGIDPIIDMGRTAINVNGVMTTALVINKLSTDETYPVTEPVTQTKAISQGEL